MNEDQNNEAIRVGIIGCGVIADVHVEAILAAEPGAEIAVADPLPGKAELLKSKYGLAGSYLDFEEMLERERLAVVHVLSPPHLHVEHARKCIAAGCSVLVEKPLCFRVAEAEELYRLARGAGVQVCVDHSLLFQPSVVKLRTALEQHGSPPVLQIDSFYGLDPDAAVGAVVPSSHWKQSLPGGALMDSLVHPISLAVGLTGAPEDLTIRRTDTPGLEQAKVMWRAGNALITLAVSQGARPFRRVTQVVTSEMSGIIDHSTEVFSILGRGFGPRSLKKLNTNFGLSFRLATGTFGTVWRVLRKKIKDNPGARNLIGAFYQHLAGEGANPTPERAVIDTTRALECAADLIGGEQQQSGADDAKAPGEGPDRAAPSRTVLVTGASGFLGRTLCRELLEAGDHRVIAQVRRGANADRIPGHAWLSKRYMDFDHCSADQLAELLGGVDEVVHCAHAAGAKNWADYERRNVSHALELYEAAAKAGCNRFVHLSSLAVYGVRARGRHDSLDEMVPVGKGTSKWDFYIRSKARAEQVLLERAASGGPRLLILRPGILYSAEGDRLLGKSFPTRGGRLFICMGSGKNHLPYTRVDRVAELIRRVLKMEPLPEGVFNISGAQDECWKDFLTRRCEGLGLEPRFLHLPAPLFRAGAWGLESLYSLTRRDRAPRITRYIVNSATRDLVYDCSKAREQLGWDPLRAVAPIGLDQPAGDRS